MREICICCTLDNSSSDYGTFISRQRQRNEIDHRFVLNRKKRMQALKFIRYCPSSSIERTVATAKPKTGLHVISISVRHSTVIHHLWWIAESLLEHTVVSTDESISIQIHADRSFQIIDDSTYLQIYKNFQLKTTFISRYVLFMSISACLFTCE